MTTLDVLPEAPTALHLNRDQILRVTSRCLREYGYDATTIRKIASLLGCAVGSIYRYFRDKRELLSAVTQQMLEPVAVLIEAREPFERTARLYHELVTHSPETYSLMFWLAAIPGDPAGREADRRRAGLPEVVSRIVRGWAGQLGDPRLAEQRWALLHGAVLLGARAEAVSEALRPASPPAEEDPVLRREAVVRQAGVVEPATAAEASVGVEAQEDVCLL